MICLVIKHTDLLHFKILCPLLSGSIITHLGVQLAKVDLSNALCKFSTVWHLRLQKQRQGSLEAADTVPLALLKLCLWWKLGLLRYGDHLVCLFCDSLPDGKSC